MFQLLSDNSNIFVILVLATIAFFFIQFQISWFLVWWVIFLLEPGHFRHYITRLRILLKACWLVWLSLCQGEGRVPPHCCQMGLEVQVPYSASSDSWVWRRFLTARQGWEFWFTMWSLLEPQWGWPCGEIFYFLVGLLWYYPKWGAKGMPCYCGQGVECEAPLWSSLIPWEDLVPSQRRCKSQLSTWLSDSTSAGLLGTSFQPHMVESRLCTWPCGCKWEQGHSFFCGVCLE